MLAVMAACASAGAGFRACGRNRAFDPMAVLQSLAMAMAMAAVCAGSWGRIHRFSSVPHRIEHSTSHRIPRRNRVNTGASAKKKANPAELALDWWWWAVVRRKNCPLSSIVVERAPAGWQLSPNS